MREYYFTRLFLCLLGIIPCTLQAQQFSFDLIFEDSAGNTDTLVIGYDTQGTIYQDTVFGEVNLAGTPMNTPFEVRITNAHQNQGDSLFETKKQIVPDSCSGWWFPQLTIAIHCEHWPVKLSWDSTLFGNACLEGSVFTPAHPGGWWDVAGHPASPGRVFMSGTSSETFTSNFNPANPDPVYYLVHSPGDTVPVYWFAFGDSSLIRLNTIKPGREVFRAYPNPARDYLSLDLVNSSSGIREVYMYDANGKEWEAPLENDRIDIRQLPQGIYRMRVILENGHSGFVTWLKQE